MADPIDELEKSVNAHIEHHEEMERIAAWLNRERRDLLDFPPPRTVCPGCFAAIYHDASAQGWCCDCHPHRVKIEKEAYGY